MRNAADLTAEPGRDGAWWLAGLRAAGWSPRGVECFLVAVLAKAGCVCAGIVMPQGQPDVRIKAAAFPTPTVRTVRAACSAACPSVTRSACDDIHFLQSTTSYLVRPHVHAR